MTIAARAALGLLGWVAALLPQSGDLDRWIGLARDGAPHIRPQAAQRLLDAGAEGAQALRRELDAAPSGAAGLGADLIEIMARFGDAELRARAWTLLDDSDFPWRPSAARSLVAESRAEELPRFAALLSDPIPGVRIAALGAFPEVLSGKAFEVIFARLSDEDGRVRRAAAFELSRRGERWAALWLLEDLERTDRWFEVDTGRQARFDAARLLRALGHELGSFDPSRPPHEGDNPAALFELRSRVENAFEREPPMLPPVARAEDVVPPGRLGLELRSCRRGELFLQWGPGDLLFVGRGRAREVRLAEGAVAALERRAREVLGALGERTSFGRPGCDLEGWRFDLGPEAAAAVYLQKGPEPVAGLRPESLDALAEALLEALPASESSLAQRLAAALEAVGGPVGAGADD
jgi:hypothetical protein